MKQITTYVGIDAHKKDLFIAMLVGTHAVRATAVTTVYQRDSSLKRPRASVVSAARAPTRRSTTW